MPEGYGPSLQSPFNARDRSLECLPRNQIVGRQASGVVGGGPAGWEANHARQRRACGCSSAALGVARAGAAAAGPGRGQPFPAVAAAHPSRLSGAEFSAVRHPASRGRLGRRAAVARGPRHLHRGQLLPRKSPPSSRAASGRGSTIRRSSGFRSILTARSCSAGLASPCTA